MWRLQSAAIYPVFGAADLPVALRSEWLIRFDMGTPSFDRVRKKEAFIAMLIIIRALSP